jgi:hypothetical protein
MWLRTLGRIYAGVSRQGSRLMTGVWVFFATAISGSRKLGHANKARKVIFLRSTKLPTAARFAAQRHLIFRYLCVLLHLYMLTHAMRKANVERDTGTLCPCPCAHDSPLQLKRKIRSNVGIETLHRMFLDEFNDCWSHL